MNCFFVSDLHGHIDRYEKLAASVLDERPDGVFLGGDLLPRVPLRTGPGDFIGECLAPTFTRLQKELGVAYPAVFVILGNDDPAAYEPAMVEAAGRGLWHYVHAGYRPFGAFDVYGYACVPPTPFLLKDWERYDVSRSLDPGCVSPEEGVRTVDRPGDEIRYGTMQQDLERLVGSRNLTHALFLFHSPPYDTPLDRAGLDGHTFEHVPLDLHVGSIAIRRFIEQRQPLLTLHGHVHEAARLTGSYRTRIGRTTCLGGAHDGPELALISFHPEEPENATRRLI